MEYNRNGLQAAYRRRAILTRAGVVLLTTSLGLPSFALPQQPPVEEKTERDRGERRRRGSSSGGEMRVIPIQRANRTERQRGASGQTPGSAIPGASGAQTPGGGAPLSAPGGGTPFSFDFRGADISNVLKFYAQMSNLNVVTDPNLTGPVTIINPKPITLEEAFKVLQAVLQVRGFTAIQNGSVLSVVPLDRGVTGTTLVSPGLDENGKPLRDPKNQVMTQVLPLENVDAEALSKELAPLINKGASLIGSPGTNALILTDTAWNVQRFIELVEALDKTANNSELKVYPLRRAEATAIADIINNLYKQISTRGRGPAGGQPQPGMPPQMQPGQPGAQAAGRPAVVAVADARTNSVLVVASPDNQEQIARNIINRLDGDDTNTIDTKVRKIKFGNAVEIANLVNTALSNMRAGAGVSGSANPSFQSRIFGGFDFGGGGGGGSQQSVSSSDPFGKVAADPRTNTVLISATPEKMRTIEDLIDQLDVDVPVETTTFVIPLKNAQAQDVAAALAQALGTGQQGGGGGFGGIFFNPFGGGGNQQRSGPGQRRRVNRSFSTGNNQNSGFRSVPPGPPNAPDGTNGLGGYNGANGGSAMPDGIPGVMTSDGFVPYEDGNAENKERTRQFGFGGFGFGRQRGPGQGGGPQFGRGRSGSYANLLQLFNNVFVTPSPGGDSIIVTTTPDNFKAIQDIVEALDVVQRQVLIEVIVAEVTLDLDEKLGISLGGRLKNLFSGTNDGRARINLPGSGFSNAFDATATGAQFTITGVDYDSLLQALTNDNKVKVLSTPRIFTTNNQEALIEIVTALPYITSQNLGLIGGALPANQVEFLNVGFNLNVVPSITRQGLVTIDLAQEASDLLRFDTVGAGNNALRVPVANVRFANTLVTVQDGETVAIGGLLRDSISTNITKIPIISEIPLIGQFFRSRQRLRNKVELVIFLTPRVINSVEEAREMTIRQGGSILRQMPNLKDMEPNLNALDPKKQPKKKDSEKKEIDQNGSTQPDKSGSAPNRSDQK